MKRILIILFCLLQYVLYSQDTEFHVFFEDREKYFKDSLSKFVTYHGIDHLKDSLPDGNYYFHDEKKKDSTRSSIVLIAHFKNGLKDSLFETFRYEVIKREKRMVSYASTFFLEGKKNGIELGYNVIHKRITSFSMTTFNSYKHGLKDGICISFFNGQIITISRYENGEFLKYEFQNPYW